MTFDVVRFLPLLLRGRKKNFLVLIAPMGVVQLEFFACYLYMNIEIEQRNQRSWLGEGKKVGR